MNKSNFLQPKIILLIIIVLLTAIVAGGFWAKNDADTKADRYTSTLSEQKKQLEEHIQSLTLSGLIINESLTGKIENLSEQQRTCSTARELGKELKDGSSYALPKSVGEKLSQKYQAAKKIPVTSLNVDDVMQYAEMCTYYVYDTARRTAEREVFNDSGYKAALTQDPARCGGRTTCINQENYGSVVPYYDKIIEINQTAVEQYKNAKCPLRQHSEICSGITKFVQAIYDDRKAYQDALKAGDRDALNEAAKLSRARTSFDELTQTTKKINPQYQTVNDYYREVLRQLEATMRQAVA